MKRKQFNQLAYTAIPVMVLVIFAYIAAHPDILGMEAGDGNTLVNLFPSLFLIAVSVVLVSRSRGTGVFGGFLGFGLGLVLLITDADTATLIPEELLAGLAVNELQIWIMAFAVIFGAIGYSYKK